jgi:hypothetical protein
VFEKNEDRHYETNLGILQYFSRFSVAQRGRTFVLNVKPMKMSRCIRFEVFTAVTMKNSVFWDVTPCGSCKNRRSSETSILTRATQRDIPEDGILHVSM